MTLLAVLLFAFWTPSATGLETGTPVCDHCTQPAIEHKAGSDRVLANQIAQKAQVERIPDAEFVTQENCPDATFQMNPDFGLQTKAVMVTVTHPQVIVKNAQGKFITQAAWDEKKEGCHLHFPKACGSPDSAPIQKLDWMKTTLRNVSPAVCLQAVEQFGDKCGPWTGYDFEKRKSETIRLVREAITAFLPGPTAAKVPLKDAASKKNLKERAKEKTNGKAAEKEKPVLVPVIKTAFLTADLAQCLLEKENIEFKPNKLNYTECEADPQPQEKPKKEPKSEAGTSTANGLFQITESTVHDLMNRHVLGNYCWEFADYWKKILPEPVDPALTNAALYPRPATCSELFSQDLVENMSRYPEFQVVAGIADLNDDLERALFDPKRPHKEYSTHDPHRDEKLHDDVVLWALSKFWFASRMSLHPHKKSDPSDAQKVLDCTKCLGGDQKSCH